MVLKRPENRKFHSRALSNNLCLSVVQASFILGLGVPVKIGLRIRAPLCAFLTGRILSGEFLYLLLIRGAVLEHVTDDLEHFRRDCYQRAFLSPSCSKPLKAFREVGTLCSCCRLRSSVVSP